MVYSFLISFFQLLVFPYLYYYNVVMVSDFIFHCKECLR